MASLGTAARKGVLIKGGVFVEELAKVQIVAFDKTGTITHGAPQVVDVVPVPGNSFSTEHALAVAAGIESRSQHPLARAVMQYAEARHIRPEPISEFRSLTGAGAAARLARALLARCSSAARRFSSRSSVPYRPRLRPRSSACRRADARHCGRRRDSCMAAAGHS